MKKLIVILSILFILINTNIGHSEPYFPETIYTDNNPKWVSYFENGNDFKLEVLVNGKNIIGKAISGETGIIFVTRDIITNKYKWKTMYRHYKISSIREVAFWDYCDELSNEPLGISDLYILVYKDKYTNRYQSYCYNAQLYNINGKLISVKKDNLGDYHLPYVDEIPKLQLAIAKYLKVNGYNSLDELFRSKGIN